jgi:propionyl-CoA carboxylase alpha chain
MFRKLLIANRGEIACRVIRTARAMGIQTVAVYSEADQDALHVQMADEAVPIGPAPSNQSYLVIKNIVQACKKTGAEAVHPGYGFLSENAEFCRALQDAGVTFVGPDVDAIRAMGDKLTSKKLAQEAGVNCVPGFTGVIRDPDHAVEIAAGIGYPVMLKASAGGGGKGMRVAWNEAECREGFERATNEARSSFGDDRVFVEKFVEEPRHIEIQIMADMFGNTIYLGERECSIQRRHQKVIEEAPSPFLDQAARRAMGEQAVALARAVQYRSAGTVEFIVDGRRNFYFLEMNTRLQVEHPVTEMVTGLDLVELMLRVAAGEELPLKQEDVKLSGWAVESRIYAEDPFRNFLPSIGRLVHYRRPRESEDIRVDTGVYEGGEVSMYYDPMIAKLVARGRTRPEAIDRMRDALDEYFINGVRHNISFVSAIMCHPRFREGRLSTNFIEEEYPGGFTGDSVKPDDPAHAVVIAAVVHRYFMDQASQISGQLPGYEWVVHNNWAVTIDDVVHYLTIDQAAGGYRVHLEGNSYHVMTKWNPGEFLLHAKINREPVCFQVWREGLTYRMFHRGAVTRATVMAEQAARLLATMPKKEAPDLTKFLMAPMPGLLAKLFVVEGQEVKAGEPLAVLEAMKMENLLRAENDATVKQIKGKEGDSLMVDQVIMEFA